MQMYNSFLVLFEHALNPGGAYFLEDLMCSRGSDFIDGDGQHVMIDVVKEWIEALTMVPRVPTNAYRARFELPPRIKSIECFEGICVFTKCFKHDLRCVQGNETLLGYSAEGTAKMLAG